MASKIQGITVEIGGSTVGLQKALSDVNKKSRDLQSELKAVERGLKLNPGNTELIAQKQQILSEQVSNTTEKLDRLKKAQQEVEQQFKSGAIGADQYRAFQREVVATEGQLDGLKSKLDSIDDGNSIKNAKQDMEKLERASREASTALKDIGNSIGTGAAVGAAAVGGLVTGMQDTNDQLAKLKTQASETGLSLEELATARGNFASIGEDVEQATEAMGNLMQAGYQTQDSITAISESISGAVVKYGETFNIEGLAESITTTTQLGEVTGQFMDLLEKEGVNVESFNEQLQSMATTEERANLVSQTLSDQGLTSMFNKYREMNPEVTKNAEAQLKFQDALSELSIVLAPLVTQVTDIITKMVEWANENPKLAQGFAIVSAAVTAIMGVIMALIPVFTALTAGATALGIGMLPLVGIVAGVVAAIAGLIAIGVLLYKNWDEVKAKTIEIWGSIKAWFSSFWSETKQTFSEALSTISQYISGKFTSAKNTISEIWSSIKSFFSDTLSNMGSTLQSKFSEMVSSVREKMNNVLSAIREVWGNVTSFFSGINLYNIGVNIIQGLINGVKSMAQSVVSSVKSVVNDAIEGAKNLLGIKSPSRVFMEIGEYTGEGFQIGMTSMISDIQKASDKMIAASIPSVPNVQAGHLSSGTDSRVIGLLSQIAKGIEMGMNPTVVMDGRIVASVIDPHIETLRSQRNFSRMKFSGENL